MACFVQKSAPLLGRVADGDANEVQAKKPTVRRSWRCSASVL